MTQFHLAAAYVGVLAVSGTYHAWTRAGSVGSLFSTPYGYAFWLKVIAVSAMLVMVLTGVLVDVPVSR